jgi:hypothetical protein
VQGHTFITSCELYISLIALDFVNEQVRIHWALAYLEVDTLIEPHICVANSREVVQTHSHPPIPNRRSHCPAWERRLPVKYIVAVSPRLMSLMVDVEIKSMDTAVK